MCIYRKIPQVEMPNYSKLQSINNEKNFDLNQSQVTWIGKNAFLSMLSTSTNWNSKLIWPFKPFKKV